MAVSAPDLIEEVAGGGEGGLHLQGLFEGLAGFGGTRELEQDGGAGVRDLRIPGIGFSACMSASRAPGLLPA
jgi:hypothetical protein